MKEYYYNRPGTTEKAGPISEESLRAGAADGTYPPDTLVWCEGMPAWAPLSRVLAAGELSPQTPAQTACPPTHLTAAVILTILHFFLFPPFCIISIIAIVKACNVEPLWRQGRAEEARQASRAASTLNVWGVFLLALPFVLIFLVIFAFASPAFASFPPDAGSVLSLFPSFFARIFLTYTAGTLYW